MNSYQYKDLTIEVLNEPTYRFGSMDNNFIYSEHYFGEGGQDYPTSKHGIKVFHNDEILKWFNLADVL